MYVKGNNFHNNNNDNNKKVKNVKILLKRQQERLHLFKQWLFQVFFFPAEALLWGRCICFWAESASCWYAKVDVSRRPCQAPECLQVTFQLCLLSFSPLS